MTAMGQQLRALSQPFRPVDDAAFIRAFERKMARYGLGSGADFKDILNAGMDVLRDNGLRLDPSLTLGMKAITQASSWYLPLAPPDRTFTAAAVEIVLEQAQAPTTEVMVKEMLRKEATKVAGQAAHAAPEYLKSLVSWNNQLKKGKLTVSVDTSSLDSQMGQFRQIAAMMMIALLVAGGIIGSAIAASALQGSGTGWSSTPNSLLRVLALGVVLVVLYTVRLFRAGPTAAPSPTRPPGWTLSTSQGGAPSTQELRMSQDPLTGTGPTDTNPVAAPGAPETDLVKVDSPVASAPEWVAPMIRQTLWRIVWVVIVVAVLIVAVLRARSLVSMLVISLFFGIAMDPAVSYLHRRFGWKRGAATGLVFAGLVLAVATTLLVLIPGLVEATNQMSGKVPDWITQIESTFGISIDGGKPPAQVQADLHRRRAALAQRQRQGSTGRRR